MSPEETKLYFFGYKTGFFLSKTITKTSSKMDLDIWDCLGRKTRILAKFHRTDLVICSHFRQETPSYKQINGESCHENSKIGTSQINTIIVLKVEQFGLVLQCCNESKTQGWN